MCDYSKAIVIDNGAYMTKVGFAGEEAPIAQFPTVIGKRRFPGYRGNQTFVGHEAISKQGVLALGCPLSNGTVFDWSEMEAVWRHTFNKVLRVPASERPILLMDAPGNSDSNREKMVQTMFEKFNAPAVCVVSQATLSLFANGQKTGLVLESGEDMTQAVAIVDGKIVPNSVSRVVLGGQHLTRHLIEMVGAERGHHFGSRPEVDYVKEKLCYTSIDFDGDMSTRRKIDAKYELPDGRSVTLGTERFRCPEALFKPALVGVLGPGLHEMIQATVMKCDEEIRDDLYANIVLGGGSTLFTGFGQRLRKEVRKLAKTRVRVFDSKGGERSAWIGGAKEAASESFQDRWITKEEFAEFGAAIVEKKYF